MDRIRRCHVPCILDIRIRSRTFTLFIRTQLYVNVVLQTTYNNLCNDDETVGQILRHFVITLRYSQSCCVPHVWVMPNFYIDIPQWTSPLYWHRVFVKSVTMFNSSRRSCVFLDITSLHTNIYFLRMMVCIECYRLFKVLTLQPWWCQFLNALFRQFPFVLNFWQ